MTLKNLCKLQMNSFEAQGLDQGFLFLAPGELSQREKHYSPFLVSLNVEIGALPSAPCFTSKLIFNNSNKIVNWVILERF